MSQQPSRPQPPLYYDYLRNPLKVVGTPEGGLRAYRLNRFTGRFDVHNEALDRIRLSPSSAEIFGSDEDEFTLATEHVRARNLRGDGPIFTIYRLRTAITEAIRVLEEPAKLAIQAAIPPLYHQTFRMWEDEFARRDAGEPPTFHYEHVAGPDVEQRWITPDPTPDMPPDEVRYFLR